MAHSISITTVGNALGQYCVKFGKRINQTLRIGLELEAEIPKMSCDYAYQGQDVSISDVSQPYQKAFTPNNVETFDGELTILQLGKIDLEFDYDEMEKFRTKWKCNWFDLGKSEAEWSYPRYIMEEVVMPKFLEERNDLSWNGVYAAPVAGTAGAYLTQADGFAKRFVDWIASGSMTPVATGALVATTMVAQVRTFCAGLPSKHRKRKGTLHMSNTWAQAYADDYAAKFPGRDVTIKDHDKQYLRVDHYNKKIKGYESMEGSDRIFVTFDGLDSLMTLHKTGRPALPQFRIHIAVRSIKIVAEYHIAFGVETLLHLYCNEQI